MHKYKDYHNYLVFQMAIILWSDHSLSHWDSSDKAIATIGMVLVAIIFVTVINIKWKKEWLQHLLRDKSIETTYNGKGVNVVLNMEFEWTFAL